MTHMRKYTRLLAVVVQLLLFTTPLHADFNPTNPPEPNITNSLTVGVTPTEAGRVSGGGKYKQGTSVYISTSAYTNYKFLYWTINGYPYEQTKTSFYYTMGDSAVTFIAHYEYVEPTPEPFDPTNPPEPQIKQHLSVELDIEEGGYTRGTGNYKSGERVYVQAVLETNYELQYWTINGYPYSETNKSFYYVVGDTNAHFVAHIAEKHLLTLKTQPRAAGVSTMKMNGSQFSDMLVAPGKVIDFNTTKNEDYIFRYWTINGFTHTTETAFRYTMGDTTASVVAVYDYVGTGDTTVFNPGNPPEPELRENVTVVVLSADESKGTVSGGGTYLFGTLDTITATPIDGFTFRRWHDGNTETPRVIRAERDTVYIAYFGNDTVVWNDTICYGETLSVGDSLLAESGHYEFYTTRADGYLTWNIVDLTVWHQMSSTLDATICTGESFIYEGVEYTQPGTYPLTLQNAFGCDSLVTLTLNVLPQVEDHEEHITICYGETYTWPVNGVTYDASTIVYDTTINANGCDSLNILYLTVLLQLQPIYDSITINDGSAATWNGVEYTKSGDYTTTLYDANGCPQAAYLHLYISSTSYLDDAFCQGDIYTWQGHYHADGTTPLTFTSAGTYTDTIADINGNDSICVLFLEEVPMPNLVVRPDTMIYSGESVLLWATGADYISWSPTEYITQTDELTSYATPIVTTTYTATGYNMPEGGGNLVYNGNFDLGNTGFVTDCNYFPPYTTPGSYGTYTVADDVQGFWYGYVESVKAYGGVGNMIIFDGYTTAHSVVWSQTVTVQPHTFYAFSAQVMSALDSHLDGQFALLQFAVNDEPVGPIFHSPDELYTWEKFYNVWYSGDNTTAVLTIYNQNDNPYGNDFALDEIQFAQLHEGCEVSKTVTIAVISNAVVDSTVCASELPFEWNGLSVTEAGIYQATLASSLGLLDSIVTLNLTVLEPTFTTISDTICYGESYTWAENGKTYTKSATVSVQYSSIYGCDSTITLHLTVLPAITETVVSEQFCFHDTFTWPLNGKSYNTSATDTVTLLDRHGCDSVVILQLTQLPHHETIIQDTICYGDTYLWAENGQSYSSSAVDSVVLPDSNGCDSVIFLHLTMLPEIPQTIYQDTICQGDKYTWYLTGQTYTTNTDTSVVLTNINGCDSVVRLMLHVRPTQETIINMTICDGESFEWEGNTYTVTTKRSHTYRDIYGCDSIVTLNLTVIPQIPTTILYETICYGDTYVFAGQICDSTATYTATLASIDGCDSTVTLHLTVLPEVPITEEYATICYGETYTWHAATYNTSGDYTTTLLDANGCDSLITLHLTVLPEVPITQEYATICYGETYTWHAATYNASGDYTTTLLDANGCDSLITLHLTVLPEVPITHLYDTICNGYTYTWQGTTYNTSGDYTTTLLDSNGCDSIVTLHLHVLQDIQPTEQHVSICYGETYVWNGAVYDQSGGYSTILTSVHGCDSIVKLILTVLPQNPITEETVSIAAGTSYNWHGESYSVAGDYTTTLTDSHGCDSIVILHLQTVNSNLSVTTFEQCADDPFLEFYIDDYTTFRNIAFQWDEAAHSQHLHDTIVRVTSPYISIPNTARAGVYDVQVSAVFNGQHFGAQSLTVTLLYPSSVLDQHWDDFIGVLTHDYNGGYDFVSFQWYKDSEPLPGETRSYLSSALEFGASYSAMLEDANGVKLMTCPIIATPQTEISLYPSMLTPRQMIHIHTSQYATIQFFTLTGDLLYSTQQEPGEILLQAPDRTGLYIIQIMYHDNTNRVLTRKITVR